MKEPYFTIFCGKLCRIRQDHAEPGEKQDHSSDRKWWKGQQGPVLVGTFFNSNQLTLIRAPGGGGKGRGKEHGAITQQNEVIAEPVIVEGPMKLL